MTYIKTEMEKFYEHEFNTCVTQLTDMKKQIAALREALERHGRHSEKCWAGMNLDYPEKPCTCGLDAALKGGEDGR